jgi:ketosteroid isomerase-like protein
VKDTISRAAEQLLLDEASIRTLLHRLARSVDRVDLDAIAAACDPAAIIHDAPLGYRGPAELFGIWVADHRDAVVAMATHLTNVLIEVEGDRAAVETYAITIEVDTLQRLRWRSGRYLDLLRRTHDGWKLAGREYVLDVDLPVPIDPAPAAPIGAHVEGVRTDADTSFELFHAIAGGTPWPLDGWRPG